VRFLTIFPSYLIWHYGGAFKDYRRVSMNLLWFISNFFSIELLVGTLFSPWKRLAKDEYGGGDSNFFTNFIVNVLMRISGFLIRSVTIVIGSIALLLTAIFLALGFIFWLLLPFIFFGLVLYSISFFVLK
jgi:hypothetical protein